MFNISSETSPHVSRPDQSESEGVIERAVEALLFHLFKAFAALRMYDANHPALHGSLKQLFQSFDDFLDTYGELRIQLTDSEIVFEGIPVYQEDKRKGGLIFMLFNDGIREIRFEPGLTYDEIGDFLKALTTNSRLSQEERDIVSLFWSKGFSHIHYMAVEEIPDEEIESVDKTIADLEARWGGDHVPESDPDGDRHRFQLIGSEDGWNPMTLSTNSAVISQLKTMNLESIEALLQSVAGERHFDADMELIQLIFDVLHLENKEERYLLAVKLLEDYSDELLAKGDFAKINHIVKKLKTYIERHRTCMSPLWQHTENLLSSYSHGEKLALLRQGLKALPHDQQDELRIFVTLLNPKAIEPICAFLEEIEEPTTRRTICSGLAELAAGQTSQLARPLERAPVTVAKDIITILQKIGDDSAIALLKACVNHEQAAIREEAVRALRTIDNPLAHEALMQFVSDDDPAIRTLAAEGLESFDELGRIDTLVEMARQKNFGKRSYREKKAVLAVLGKVECQESIDTLEAILSKKSLFGRKRQNETRACAAFALARVNSERTHRLLKRYSRDSSSQVRKICRQALLTNTAQR